MEILDQIADKAIVKKVVEGAALNTDFDLGLDGFLGYDRISVQIEWTGITSTKDAVVKLQQRNHNSLSFVDITNATETINTENGSAIIEINNWNGANLNLNYTKNSVSVGTMKVIVIAKKN